VGLAVNGLLLLWWSIAVIEVKRIQPHQGELLRELRLRALQDAPDAF